MGAGSVLQADDYRRILLVVDAVERSPTVGALRETTLAALDEQFGYGGSTFWVAGPLDLDLRLIDGTLHGFPAWMVEEYVERWTDSDAYMGPTGIHLMKSRATVAREEVYAHLEPHRRRYVHEFQVRNGIEGQLAMHVPTGLRADGYLSLLARGDERFDVRDRARLVILRRHIGNLLRSRLLDEANDRASLRLSPRERQVAALIAAGRSNAEIAAELGIAESTVKKHVSRALGATGLRSRTQLAASLRGRRPGG